jgi:hypothetical protein
LVILTYKYLSTFYITRSWLQTVLEY